MVTSKRSKLADDKLYLSSMPTARFRGRRWPHSRKEVGPKSAVDSDSSTSDKPREPIRRSARVQELEALKHTPRPTRSSTSAFASPQALTDHNNIAEPQVTNRSFPFFSLPPEIRTIIYRHCVYFRKGVVKAKVMSSRLILFLVNRRFFNEASTLFYSDNTFKFFSAYVSRGQDPFGCNLTRIRKCFLHLTGTRVYAEPFLFWYVKEFAAALVPHHSLEYLLLRVLLHQLPQLSPLEKLHGIKFVQVATVLWSDTGYWSALRYPKWWSLDFPHWPEPPEQRHVQRLERLVMSDGSPSSELSIRCRSAEAAVSNKAYVADPALSLHLSGDALLHAQTHGGWADGSALYGFLGVDSSKRLGRRHR